MNMSHTVAVAIEVMTLQIKTMLLLEKLFKRLCLRLCVTVLVHDSLLFSCQHPESGGQKKQLQIWLGPDLAGFPKNGWILDLLEPELKVNAALCITLLMLKLPLNQSLYSALFSPAFCLPHLFLS